MIPVVDLFAGIGGLSIGAVEAGLDVRASVEIDSIACRTLSANADYHGNIVETDVRELLGADLRSLAKLGQTDPIVIVGGAPCQPFSKAAYWTDDGSEARYRVARAAGKAVLKPEISRTPKEDERRSLVDEFWRLISETQADGFVFENVPSIAHPRNRPVLEALKAKAASAGYHVIEYVGNAIEFGVAQQRKRLFLLGAKKKMPAIPERTHGDETLSLEGLKPVVSAGEAISSYDDEAYFEPEEVVTGKWAKHLEEVPPGWNYKAHTAWAGHPNPTFEAERRFWNFLLKLSPERPSWTIAASPGPWTGPFHWKSRRLRTVELAALQGFPHGYDIQGSRRERVRQLGNAVPPPMAKAMMTSIAEAVS